MEITAWVRSVEIIGDPTQRDTDNEGSEEVNYNLVYRTAGGGAAHTQIRGPRGAHEAGEKVTITITPV